MLFSLFIISLNIIIFLVYYLYFIPKYIINIIFFVFLTFRKIQNIFYFTKRNESKFLLFKIIRRTKGCNKKDQDVLFLI